MVVFRGVIVLALCDSVPLAAEGAVDQHIGGVSLTLASAGPLLHCDITETIGESQSESLDT